MDICQANVTDVMPHMPYQSDFSEHTQTSEDPEFNVSCSTSVGDDAGDIQLTSAEAQQTSNQHEGLSASQPSLTISMPASQSFAITSISMADIIQKVEQRLVRAVEFYDSCRTLVAATVDDHAQTVVQVPRESLPHVLTKLRG